MTPESESLVGTGEIVLSDQDYLGGMMEAKALGVINDASEGISIYQVEELFLLTRLLTEFFDENWKYCSCIALCFSIVLSSLSTLFW